MSKNVACICTISHEHNKLPETWGNTITDSNYDSAVLVDCTGNSFIKKGFLYTEHDLRNSLNFHHGVSNRHYWNSFGNRNIIWFYAYLRMLHFYISYPNYEYYWFFDDDVDIDNWNEFLSDTDQHAADFISYFIFKNKNINAQPDVPEINDNTVSKHMWFERFPGHTDTLPLEIKDLFGSFFPTTRFSNRALKEILKYNNQGYFGWHEGFVPTLLNYSGLTLKTLINSDNTSNLFDNKRNKVYHKHSIINWEWI